MKIHKVWKVLLIMAFNIAELLSGAPAQEERDRFGLTEGDQRSSFASLMSQSNVSGVDVNNNILNAISFIESSNNTNPARLVENEDGALGKFQIKKDMFTDVKKHFPDTRNLTFKEAALGTRRREIASKALEVTSMNLASEGMAPTRDALITAYHSGAGNVSRGNIGKKGKKYLKDINALLDKN